MVEISSYVTGTIVQFIDTAMFIVLILFIYYFYKAVTFDEDSDIKKTKREDSEKERAANTKKWVEDKIGHSRRKNLINPIKGFIIHIEQKANWIEVHSFEKKSSHEIRKARSYAKETEINLKHALLTIRKHKKKVTGDVRDYFNTVQSQIEATYKYFNDNVRDKFPDNASDPDWDTKVSSIQSSSKKVTAYCGVMVKSIDEFIKGNAGSLNVFTP
jgi:hypothetical protein